MWWTLLHSNLCQSEPGHWSIYSQHNSIWLHVPFEFSHLPGKVQYRAHQLHLSYFFATVRLYWRTVKFFLLKLPLSVTSLKQVSGPCCTLVQSADTVSVYISKTEVVPLTQFRQFTKYSRMCPWISGIFQLYNNTFTSLHGVNILELKYNCQDFLNISILNLLSLFKGLMMLTVFEFPCSWVHISLMCMSVWMFIPKSLYIPCSDQNINECTLRTTHPCHYKLELINNCHIL